MEMLKILSMIAVLASLVSCNQNTENHKKCLLQYENNDFLGTDSCVSSLSKKVFLERVSEKDSLFINYNLFYKDSVKLILNKKLVDISYLTIDFSSCSLPPHAGSLILGIEKSKENILEVVINNDTLNKHVIPKDYLTLNMSFYDDSLYLDYSNKVYGLQSMIKPEFEY